MAALVGVVLLPALLSSGRNVLVALSALPLAPEGTARGSGHGRESTRLAGVLVAL